MQRSRWQVDKKVIGLSRVQHFNNTQFMNYSFNFKSGLRTRVDLRCHGSVDSAASLFATSVGVRTSLDWLTSVGATSPPVGPVTPTGWSTVVTDDLTKGDACTPLAFFSPINAGTPVDNDSALPASPSLSSGIRRRMWSLCLLQTRLSVSPKYRVVHFGMNSTMYVECGGAAVRTQDSPSGKHWFESSCCRFVSFTTRCHSSLALK